MARWLIASAAFLAVGWLDFRFGHAVALGALLALIIVVAVYGGHGPRRRPAGADTEVAGDEAPGPRPADQPGPGPA